MKIFLYLKNIKWNSRALTITFAALVLCASYFTYFRGYSEPPNAFYDEVYHIAGAEKYLNGYMYFEVHPPVGKLFIALGELIFSPNKSIDIKAKIPALERGYIKGDWPADYSYKGVRFFPTLFGVLNAVLLFLIFYIIARNNLLALAFSSMYLFENSAIVHFRGALLDSTMIFFALISILYFLHLYETKKQSSLLNYFILGCLFSLATFTKIVGSVLLLLFIFLVLKEMRDLNLMERFKSFAKSFALYVLGALLTCCLVYYLHVSIGSNILNNNTGTASPRYIEMIKNKEVLNPLKIYVPMRDHFRDMKLAHSNISPLDVCKPNEVGSHPIGWPIGIKGINYLLTTGLPDGKSAYLSFVMNPVNWYISLVAVVLAISLILSRIVFKVPVKNERLYNYIFIFTSLYVGFMAAIIWGGLQRILYIHIYLMPLVFSFIVCFLVFIYLFEEYLVKKDKFVVFSLLLFVGLIFYCYVFFSPLTYYKPLTYLECAKRSWLDIWKVFCAR